MSASLAILLGNSLVTVHMVQSTSFTINFSFLHFQDRETGDSKSAHEIRDGESVKGYYTVMDADGKQRTVHYTANDKDGFRATVQRTLTNSHGIS